MVKEYRVQEQMELNHSPELRPHPFKRKWIICPATNDHYKKSDQLAIGRFVWSQLERSKDITAASCDFQCWSHENALVSYYWAAVMCERTIVFDPKLMKKICQVSHIAQDFYYDLSLEESIVPMESEFVATRFFELKRHQNFAVEIRNFSRSVQTSDLLRLQLKQLTSYNLIISLIFLLNENG